MCVQKQPRSAVWIDDLPKLCSRRLWACRRTLFSCIRGLDEHQLQKLLAAEQRNHSFTAMKQAAVGNILAVFPGWKCNGLNLSLDFVEANSVAQPLMLTGLNYSQFVAC